MKKRRDEPAETTVAGPGAMPVELVAIGRLSTDPTNARDHSDARGQRAIEESLRRFGQRKPIVCWRESPDSEALVTKAGNGTLMAALALGWTEMWVAWADGLTRAEADAYAVADNQLGLLSSWSFPVLADVLRGLEPDLQLATGFDDSSIAMLLQGEFQAGGEAGEEPLNDAPAEWGKPVKLTTAQREVFDRACARVRDRDGDASEGRVLELVCGDFLSGA